MYNIAVAINSPILADVENIEEILCLATLITGGEIPEKLFNNPDILRMTQEYFYALPNGCNDCRFSKKCLAMIIDEDM